jgi:hypothetical protein
MLGAMDLNIFAKIEGFPYDTFRLQLQVRYVGAAWIS